MSRVQKSAIVKYIILCFCTVIMIAPMIWALAVSLMGPGKAYIMPPKLFELPLRFDNYTKVLSEFNFFRAFLNSLFICGLNIIGTVISCSMVGFGFAKFESKAYDRIFFIMLSMMYIPTVTTMVPSYVLWSKLGGLDTYLPLTIGHFFGGGMFAFMMRQNFKSISNSFYEAAYIDGANPIYIFWKIYMPLSKPMIATMILRTFMASWNDMMGPLIYITTKSKYTVALALSAIGEFTKGRPELQMAGVMVCMIPVLIVYLFAQKHFIGGVASSGVKG